MEVARSFILAASGNPYRRCEWLTQEEQVERRRSDLLSFHPAWAWSTNDALVALSPEPFDTKFLRVRAASLVAHCRRLAPERLVSIGTATVEAMRAGRWALISARVYEPDDQMFDLLGSLRFRPCGHLLHMLASTAGLPPAVRFDALSVRDANANDEPLFRSLASAFLTTRLLGVPTLDVNRVRELYAAWAANDLSGRMTLNLLATIDGTAAGFLAAGVHSPDGLGREVAFIDLLVVHGAYRRRGVGRALLVEALCRLGSAGIPWVELGVSDANHAAWALYTSVGFHHAGTSSDFIRWSTQ